MKGDFSRSTFNARKHYSGVRLQQGRVLVDADWNEELDLFLHRVETETIDVIGGCGAPKHAAGFALSTATTTLSATDQARLKARGVLPLPAGDFLIGAGRYYVDGSLCENDEVVTFTTQPDLPGVKPIGASGVYVVYLDVWQRLITALEDPSIREVALGGPDTATRSKTIWQVKLLPVGEQGSDVACADEVTWPLASTGQLRARTEPNPPTTDPCVVPPGAGYRRLENQLYRVEIQRGSADANGPTFKWSRDNGSIVVAVEEFAVTGDNKQVKVKSLGRDHVLGLHKGDWVEVLDDAAELNQQPGTLAKIDDIDTEHLVLSLNTAITGYDLNGHAKVRRWDSAGEVKVEVPLTNDGYLQIEDGVEIKFDLGYFNTGDYWLIPARTVPGQFGDIEWPRDTANDPLPQPALGIQHHYCKIGIITFDKETITAIQDCRPIFPPLTELPLGGACCCTVSVGDGLHSQGDYTDIQTAIDALPEDGGTVCVLAGDYTIAKSIVLRGRSHITISGCGSRTRLIGGSTAPVFVIEGGDDIQLDALNVAARSSTAAILAGKVTDLRIVNNTIINRAQRIVEDNRRAIAARSAGPAIRIASALHVEIEHNRIGGTPAIEVLAQDLTIVNNFLRFGGIWVRSGSAEVVVDDNNIAEGEGPGIRLGNAGETEAGTKEFFYAALKRDQAATIKTHANFSKASYSRAGGFRAIAADGLAGVQITDNVIRQMGGSGITTLVDQVSGADLVAHGDIEDLVIEGNEIIECVQTPPDTVLNEGVVVAGGVLLSAVTRVRIADNTITRNGLIDSANPDQAGRYPACGVFIAEAAGVEIDGNTITDNGSPTPDGETQRAVFQAGIAALIVLGNSADISDAVQGKFDLQPGLPALRVHDNVVSCPAGHALVVTALGSVSVSGNTLTSNGYKQQPTVLGQASSVLNIGACVTIFNLGRAALAENAAGFGVDSTVNAVAVSAFPDGRTLFSGNQVTFTAALGEKLRTLISAIAFFALDDVSVQDNQVALQLNNGRVVTTGYALALTLRASGNNFSEPLADAVLSYLSWAQMNVMTSNEAIHCLIALGTKATEGNNLTFVADDVCKQVAGALLKG